MTPPTSRTVATNQRPSRRHAPWVVVANVTTAVGNLVGVFAISVASSDAAGFGLVASSLAALVFAFGVNHALIAETLSLRGRDDVVARSFLGASVTVALPLALLAGGALALHDRSRSLAMLTVAVVLCQLLVDDLRHWGFHLGRARLVAMGDLLWLLATCVLYVLALVGLVGPRQVYATWAIVGLLVFAPLLRSTNGRDVEVPMSAFGLLQSTRGTSLRLGAEAMAATAAVTVPLVVAPLLGSSAATPGAIRILQAFFGFQQIAYFSALASMGPAPSGPATDVRETHARRVGAALALGGGVLTLGVGAAVALLPTSLLQAVFGDAAAEAKAGIWWFVALQAVISIGNGAIVTLRLSGRAARATVPRVVGNLVATAAASALISRGVGGFAAGSAFGLGLVVLAVAPLSVRRIDKFRTEQ